MLRSHLKEQLQEYADLVNERGKTYSDWLKNLLTISTALLAILVALKTEKSATEYIHLAYMTVIISTATGIILGVLILYSDVRILSKSIHAKNQQIQKSLDGEEFDFEPIYHPKYYTFLKYLCYTCFLISIVSLCFYAILIDK